MKHDRSLCGFGWFVVMTVLCSPTTVSATQDYDESCEVRDPVNGIVSKTSIITGHLYVHYLCNDGYRIQGPPKQQCNTNGTWEPPDMPICIKDSPYPTDVATPTCPKPFLVNSQIKKYNSRYDSSFHPGDTILVICNAHYAMRLNSDLVSEVHLQCVQDRKWVTTEGLPIDHECTVSLCSSPPDVPHSRVSYTGIQVQYSSDVAMNGEKAYYKCEDGYSLINPQENYLMCRNHEWERSIPSCVPLRTCQHPDKISHGGYATFQNSYSFQLGSEVMYQCDEGYKLVGSGTLRCMEGSKWSHTAPQCVPNQDTFKYCPSLPSIVNGHCFCETKSDLQFCEPFFSSLQVECVCNEGFKLIGQSIVTCGKNGDWDYEIPTCVQALEIDDSKTDSSSSGSQGHMSTLAIVVATACSVLGVLLLIMVIMVFRRRKPHPQRLCHPSSTPPPYVRVNSNSMESLSPHDRMLLIGYENNQIALPSYEEAVTGRPQHSGQGHYSQRSNGVQGQVGEYRPLPSIPVNLRHGQSSGDNSNRHSIITTSTMNRDGVSEVFGSIDTVNVSMSDASTAVTVETFDSASSHYSNMSQRATAGSINSSNISLDTEDVPLLESNHRDEEIDTNGEDVQDKPE